MSHHARRVLAATLTALCFVAAAIGPASAVVPGANGRITFMRFDADGIFQIWVANGDMTNQVQITHGYGGSGFPSWSPDGTRIVFDSHRTDPDENDNTEISDVFTMKPDGSDVRRLTDSRGFSGHPSWSPDGRWIVFDADRGNYPASQGLYLVASDGSGTIRRLTTLPAGSAWQELGRFSPDGSRVAYDEVAGGTPLSHHREGAVAGEHAAVFSVKPDGTDIRQLTPSGAHCGDADWSPDGKRLVFACQPAHAGNIGDVNMVDPDGKHFIDVTHDHGLTGFGNENSFWYEESFNATWSPDGRKIIFVHASFTAEDGFRMGLQTMNPDGSDRAWLSQGEEHQPEIAPVSIAP
jgi:Tol biopolymer transport system component